MTHVRVTLDMAHDEKRWYEQLARELAAVLQGSGGKNGAGMMGDRGIIPLDEVWGGWHRARGVGEATCIFPHVPRVLKIMCIHSFLDSLAISTVTTPSTSIYGPNDHGTHIPSQWPTCATYTYLRIGCLCCSSSWDVILSGARTTLEIAKEEGVPIGLASEMVGEAEAEGVVSRDEAEHDEIRW